MPSEEASDARITVVFPGKGGRTGICPLSHVPGKRIKDYLRTPPLAAQGLVGMVAKRGKMYTRGGQRIRFYYVPNPGDVIVLIAMG